MPARRQRVTKASTIDIVQRSEFIHQQLEDDIKEDARAVAWLKIARDGGAPRSKIRETRHRNFEKRQYELLSLQKTK